MPSDLQDQDGAVIGGDRRITPLGTAEEVLHDLGGVPAPAGGSSLQDDLLTLSTFQLT